MNKPVQLIVINYTVDGNPEYSGARRADKIRIPVRNNTTNKIQVTMKCSRSTPQSSGGYHLLEVDRDGRTFFVGVGEGVHRQ